MSTNSVVPMFRYEGLDFIAYATNIGWCRYMCHSRYNTELGPVGSTGQSFRVV